MLLMMFLLLIKEENSTLERGCSLLFWRTFYVGWFMSSSRLYGVYI